SANGLTAVVDAELDRVIAAGDPLVLPEELLLLGLVGREVLERSPERTGIEGDDGKARFGEFARKGPSACASADDCEIDLLGVIVAAHRHPLAFAKHVRRTAVDRARLGDLRHRLARPL